MRMSVPAELAALGVSITVFGASLSYLIAELQADTTQYPPVRGQMRLEISKLPPLPKSTNVAHLQQLHDGYFILKDVEPNTIIYSHNRPIIEPTDSGYRIKFQ